jgi:hypothetical protein
MEYLFRRRTERHFPRWFYDLVTDMFAVVQYWEPGFLGAARGRRFEIVFHRYCRLSGLPVTERPGSRTIRHERSASGFSHESDGVIAFPDMTVHFELKYLTTELGKNELLVFNQKGLDHLVGGSRLLRATPLYRVILSGHVLTPEARRFALQWGIAVIEPDRLPFVLLHQLAGRNVPNLRRITTDAKDEIWSEVPALVTPLQAKMASFSRPMASAIGDSVPAQRSRSARRASGAPCCQAW